MITSVLLALLFIGFVLPLLSLRGITISKYVPSSMYTGKDATVELMIVNETSKNKEFYHIVECPLNTENNPYAGVVTWNPVILLIKYLHSAYIHKEYAVPYFLKSLPANDYVQVEHTFQPKNRGLYCSGKLVLASSFPFGLFRFTKTFDQKREVVVYPRSVDIRGGWINRVAHRIVVSQLSYSYIPTSIPGTTRGLRAYVPGDSPRHIHWPSSAKTGNLLVREFEIESSGFVYIILDCSSDYPSEEYFELAVTTVASLLKACYAEGLTTMFSTQSDAFDYGGEIKPENWLSQMEILARVQPVSEKSVCSLIDEINQSFLSNEKAAVPVYVLVSSYYKAEKTVNRENIVSIAVSPVYEPAANYCIKTETDLKYI